MFSKTFQSILFLLHRHRECELGLSNRTTTTSATVPTPCTRRQFLKKTRGHVLYKECGGRLFQVFDFKFKNNPLPKVVCLWFDPAGFAKTYFPDTVQPGSVASRRSKLRLEWPSTHQCTIQKILFWDFLDVMKPNPRTGFWVHSFFFPHTPCPDLPW
jgi:hypothetical protein